MRRVPFVDTFCHRKFLWLLADPSLTTCARARPLRSMAANTFVLAFKTSLKRSLFLPATPFPPKYPISTSTIPESGSSDCLSAPRIRRAMRHAHLYVISRSLWIVFAARPLLAFENIMNTWNHIVSGTFDFSKIVPASGATWNEQREQWYCFRPLMRENVPPHEQRVPCRLLNIYSRHASSEGNRLRRLRTPNRPLMQKV